MIEPGIDAPLAYDRFKRPMLPFSLIKGKVRDAVPRLDPRGDPRWSTGWAQREWERASTASAVACDSVISSPRSLDERRTM